MAVCVAGVPERWFHGASPAPTDAMGRTMTACGDADLGVIVGLGGGTATASVPADHGVARPQERTLDLREVCLAESRRFAPPALEGGGPPLAVDIRACLDRDLAPALVTRALPVTEGNEPAVIAVAPPLGAMESALSAVISRGEPGPVVTPG